MAKKRRKLAGAALAAHLKKAGRKARRVVAYKAAKPRVIVKTKYRTRKVKVTKVIHHRAKHVVQRHHRKGGHVHGYLRHGSWVKKHLSNPFGLGQAGTATLEGVVAVGVLLGTVFAAGFINRQVQRIPQLQVGYPNLLGKVAVALGLTVLATRFIKDKELRKVAVAGSFIAPTLGALAMFAPALASQITLAEEEGMDAQLNAGLRAQLSMSPGNRLSDATIDEEQGRETEQSMF